MPFAFIGRSAPAVVLSAMLLVAASLLWGVYDGYRSERAFQHELAVHSTQDVAKELADIVQRLRVDVGRLAEGRGTNLSRLAENPGDRDLQAYMANLLRERFNEYYAYSLATSEGELLTDLGEDISEACRQDLRRFAAGSQPYRPYLHPTPGHYHFDIMVRWQDGYEQGILFVSFHADQLASELSGNQIPGHQLMLVRADSPRLVEVTAAGSRDVRGDQPHLTDAELARQTGLGASAPVLGTDWLAIDVPDAELMDGPLQRLYWQMGGIIAVFLLLGGILARFARNDLRRQAEEETRKARYQQELERRVLDRTRDLRESRAELERAQAISHIGNWKLTYPGEVLWASTEAKLIHGFPAEATPSLAEFLARLHPADRPLFEAALRAARDGTPMDLEYRLELTEGERTVRGLSHGSRPLDDGTLVLEGTCQDISARKAEILELRRFAQIVETSGDLMAYVDADLRYLVANPAYAALFRQTPESLRGLTVREIFGEDMYQLVGPYMARALEGRGQRFTSEREFPDGRHHILDVEYQPFRNQGEVQGVVISIRDISQRVMAERALRDSELKLRAMLNTPFMFIGLLDVEGRVLQINATALRTMDRKEVEVQGLPIWDLPWFNQDEGERERMREAVRRGVQGHTTRFESSYRLASGEDRMSDFTLSPLRNAEGRVVWLVPQGIDITERKTAESLLQHDREQQATLRELLETILKGGGLEDTLGRCLTRLLEVSWLSIQPKGGVFLLDEDGATLRLAVAHNLSPEIRSSCARVAAGVCHCGQAALTRQVQFAHCVDHRHSIRYDGMMDHGHYSLPLMLGGQLLGVLVLYLPAGFVRDPVKEEFILAVTDILASFLRRMKDEQALRDSETLTRAVMDSLNSSIAVLDGEGRIIRVNRAWSEFAMDNDGDKLLGAGVGLDYLDVTRQAADQSDEGAREVLEGMREVLEGRREMFTLEYPCHSPDQERWFMLQVTPLGGALKGLVTTQTNITQRKLAEMELERYQKHLEEIVADRTGEVAAAEERLRLILESTADGLFGMDTAGLFTFVNPVACAMLGYRPDQLIGRPVHRTIHHTHRDGKSYEPHDCAMMATLRDGSLVRHSNEVFWRADGIALPVAYATHPMIRAGEIVGAVVSFTDITVLLQSEAAREQALAEAERLARIRSEFLANMSHEIRTPLNAVLGLAQVGLREGDARKSREIFGRVLDSGQLLLGIVNDILDFSKIEAGRLVMEQRLFSPAEVIDRTVALIADRAYAKGLEFMVEEAEDLPVSCSGDDLRLSQVLVNLLSNAVKFTEHGRVTLQVRRQGESLMFRIGDTGIGMNAEQLSRIFTPFEQADGSTTRRFGGTGLGLAICKRLVDLMGGELDVVSHPGAGSIFQIRFPLVLALARPAEAGLRRVFLEGFAEGERAWLEEQLAKWGAETVADMAAADLVFSGAEPAAGPRALLERALALGKAVVATARPGVEHGAPIPGVRMLDRPIRLRQLWSILDVDSEASPQTTARSGQRLRGVSILAAEDNEINRLVLEEMLAAEGASLLCLENGQEAVEQLRRVGDGAYDIVLTDIQMPVMDGYETACNVRAMAPDLPVVGITAHAMAEEKARCFAAGMVAHLAKPVDLEALVDTILRHARPSSRETMVTVTQASAEPVPEQVVAEVPAGNHSADQPVASPIDWERLEARFNGKKDFVEKLVRTAATSQADSPAKLRAAVAEADLKSLAFLAHGIKGMSGNLMADALRDLAARTEQAAKGESPEAAALGRELAEAMDGLLAALAAMQPKPA